MAGTEGVAAEAPAFAGEADGVVAATADMATAASAATSARETAIISPIVMPP
jgi:hypothetical protein